MQDQDNKRDSHDDQLGQELESLFENLCHSGSSPGSEGANETGEFNALGDIVELLAELNQLASEPSDDSETQPVYFGKFQLCDFLAIGGQSVVVLAKDPDLDRTVVLKIYRKPLSSDQQDKVSSEGKALARIDSPHVARCHALERVGRLPFLVVEYVDGEDLNTILSAEGPLPCHVALRWAKQIALGLRSIHSEKLLHRDLKPANVVVNAKGEAKLVDLGLAEFVSDESNDVVGTWQYAAPEQARGESLDPRADLFSFGAVLFAMLTGRSPYDVPSSQSPLERAQSAELLKISDSQFMDLDIPPDLQAIVERCLSPLPGSRFKHVNELLSSLESAQLPSLVPKPTVARTLAYAGIAIAAILLAWFTIATLNGKRTNDDPPSDQLQIVGAQDEKRPDDAPPQRQHVGAQDEKRPEDDPPSNERQSVEEPNPFQRPLRTDFAMTVDIAQGGRTVDGQFVVRHGKNYALKLVASRECFVQVYSLEGEQRVLLFPNSLEKDSRLEANQTRFIPSGVPVGDENETIEFTAYRPEHNYDQEYLYIVASDQPLPNIDGDESGDFKVLRSPEQLRSFDEQFRSTRLQIRKRKKGNSPQFSEVIMPYAVD